MAGQLRKALTELAEVFGRKLAEAEEQPAEQAVTDVLPPLPAEPADRAAEPVTPEMAYLKSSGLALSVLKGREFQAAPGATLKVVKVKSPQFHRPKKHVDVLVPLIVAYAGKAAPEQWAVAEIAMEKEVLGALRANASQAGPLSGRLQSLRFLRRRKSDPLPDEPESLTLLRFRA